MIFSQCNTQWLYTLRYNINGSVATSRAMPTPFYLSIMKLTCVLEFHVYNYEFNNSLESCTLENIISKYSKTSHADTLGAGPLSLLVLERLSYTKLICRSSICPFSEVIL